MEFRKLISFGKTSYVMSIPKAWVVKNKLKKGDLLSLDEKEDHIILSPRQEQTKKELKEITVNVDGKTIEQIKREIIPAYINNYNSMTLIGKNLKEKAKDIRDVLQNLMALEIMEQTSSKIVAKDFLNMEMLSIKDLIKKMDIITRDMISDSKLTIEEDHFENICHRDEDVNRLNYLILRAIKYALENPAAAKDYKMTQEELFAAWRISEHLEKIADENKRIARYLRKLKLHPTKAKKLIDLYSKVEKLYLDTMKAYRTDDKALAYSLASMKSTLLNECQKYQNQEWKEKYVANIIEKFKIIIVSTHNMGRIFYT